MVAVSLLRQPTRINDPFAPADESRGVRWAFLSPESANFVSKPRLRQGWGEEGAERFCEKRSNQPQPCAGLRLRAPRFLFAWRHYGDKARAQALCLQQFGKFPEG